MFSLNFSSTGKVLFMASKVKKNEPDVHFPGGGEGDSGGGTWLRPRCDI